MLSYSAIVSLASAYTVSVDDYGPVVVVAAAAVVVVDDDVVLVVAAAEVVAVVAVCYSSPLQMASQELQNRRRESQVD